MLHDRICFLLVSEKSTWKQRLYFFQTLLMPVEKFDAVFPFCKPVLRNLEKRIFFSDFDNFPPCLDCRCRIFENIFLFLGIYCCFVKFQQLRTCIQQFRIGKFVCNKRFDRKFDKFLGETVGFCNVCFGFSFCLLRRIVFLRRKSGKTENKQTKKHKNFLHFYLLKS